MARATVKGSETEMNSGGLDFSRWLRLGYLALAVFLLSFLARQGVDALREHVRGRPCFAFDPQRIRVEPRPPWIGPRFDDALIRRLRPLRGCSVLHPDFRPWLRHELRTLPWIRRVTAIRVESGQRVGVFAQFRRPVARLADRDQDLYLDEQGVAVPGAGVVVQVPWIRSSTSETLDPVERLVAGQEAAFLLDRTRATGPFWESLEGLELATEFREDGQRYSRVQLVFRRTGEPGSCRVHWGRGSVEARSADLDAETKYRNTLAVLRAFPGWRSMSEARVFVRRPTIRRSAGPAGAGDSLAVSGTATGP